MVDLVLNRRARRLAADGPIRRALLGAAREIGATVHETNGFLELEAVAKAIAARGTERVILAGGDGSYMAGVTALAQAFGDAPLPPVALAPGGTVGTVARNWGRDGHARWDAETAARIVRAAAGGAPSVQRPTLRVTDDRGGARIGFIFGAGLVASFFDEYYAAATQGYLGAASIVAQVFAQSIVGGDLARRVLDPVAARITVDGQEASPRGWSLVMASVIRDVGLHMLVTPHAGKTLGAFHVVGSALGPRALGPQMPLVLAGRRLRGRGHVDVPEARELVVRFDDEARGAYVLDGDTLRATTARVTPGPTLDVLAP